MNTPTLGIFGPSGTFDWGPWPNGWVGEGTPFPGWNGIKITPPHVVIQDDRDCGPCGQAGCFGKKRSACLDELAVEKVMGPLANALVLDFNQAAP
jgi:heptosyltransferase-3